MTKLSLSPPVEKLVARDRYGHFDVLVADWLLAKNVRSFLPVFLGSASFYPRPTLSARHRHAVGMLAKFLLAFHLCVKRVPRAASLITTALAILLGFLVFYLGQGLPPIDALYLTIVTISTVGFGDISPSGACSDDEGNDLGTSSTCVGMRVFTVLYILVGCSYVFGVLADVCGRGLEQFSHFVKLQIDRFDSTAKGVDSTGDGRADTKVTGRSLGLSGSAHDITGDGNTDFIEPPSAVVFYAQELLPAVLLLTFVQLGSAGIFTVCIPGLDFGSAFYHCMITTTTVGYGDVAMSTPEARLFACFHIIVSVSWLAAIIGWVGRLTSVREAQLQRANLILNPPDRKSIMALDHDKQGVDELEFVVGMLMSASPPSPPPLRPLRLASERCD